MLYVPENRLHMEMYMGVKQGYYHPLSFMEEAPESRNRDEDRHCQKYRPYSVRC